MELLCRVNAKDYKVKGELVFTSVKKPHGNVSFYYYDLG